MIVKLSPAFEIRAALATWRERAAAAREATVTGHGQEWLPWYGVAHVQPDPSPPSIIGEISQGPGTEPAVKNPGQALVAHHRYVHDREEAWYESMFIAGPLDARLALWIVLTGPDLADPITALLEPIADAMEDHDASEQYAGPGLTGPDRRRVVVDDRGRVRHDWTAALALARRLSMPASALNDPQGTAEPRACNGLCVTIADVGTASDIGHVPDLATFPHPGCERHAAGAGRVPRSCPPS
ncbi:hypothetical protein ETD86_46605 [Nonomuraea turkmeniaca]|uniref:Uncharacterized protein n=1 Tax=Nonomuraea turkmeniaca TaxID=103838 RepID=A0A5S4EYE5_9ACTN|nr:hypothetical protein [Nonomuraea turkmeniaca]TMR08723.1 hypothetical protein ETD86_46605 [Nonomuraea turkmeniaca]